jgi:membrane protease YdiL (CAAX protease family)
MSQKFKSIFEVLIGLILVFGYLWLILPLYYYWIKILCATPIVLFFIYSNYKRSLKDLGLRLDDWYSSFKVLLIFTSIAIPVLYVLWHLFFPVNNHFYNSFSFWKKLFISLFWALFQEYIFLAFFFRRYRDIFSPHINLAIFFSALTFSMAHIPNPPLIIFCFVGGIFWAKIYNKYPNLYTIAIFHSIFLVFLSNILLVFTVIGPDADIGRWSKRQASVYGNIERINDIELLKRKRVIDINENEKGFFVNGWIVSKNKINKIRISLGGKDYSVHYGIKREDVAIYYNNPDYLYSGFCANIPHSDFSRGYHKLFLKVYLEGELFYHSPGQRIWVRIE